MTRHTPAQLNKKTNYSLSNDTILDCSKLKAYADDKINVT